MAIKPDLQNKSKVDDPGKELSKLVKKFPDLGPHIKRPGKKGQSGYTTTIRDARKPSADG